MADSEFERWFVEQHGTRHEAGDCDKRSDEVLEREMMAGRNAERILSKREAWDARWQSALYAWTARARKSE